MLDHFINLLRFDGRKFKEFSNGDSFFIKPMFLTNSFNVDWFVVHSEKFKIKWLGACIKIFSTFKFSQEIMTRFADFWWHTLKSEVLKRCLFKCYYFIKKNKKYIQSNWKIPHVPSKNWSTSLFQLEHSSLLHIENTSHCIDSFCSF